MASPGVGNGFAGKGTALADAMKRRALPVLVEWLNGIARRPERLRRKRWGLADAMKRRALPFFEEWLNGFARRPERFRRKRTGGEGKRGFPERGFLYMR